MIDWRHSKALARAYQADGQVKEVEKAVELLEHVVAGARRRGADPGACGRAS